MSGTGSAEPLPQTTYILAVETDIICMVAYRLEQQQLKSFRWRRLVILFNQIGEVKEMN